MSRSGNLRPTVHRISSFEYRVDLRCRKFAGVLPVVSGGKKSLQFETRAAADRKADEIQAMLEKHGAQRMATVARMLDEDLNVLYAKLAPFNQTLTDAVDHYVAHLAAQKEREASETVGVLVDRWLAEKKAERKRGTLRQRTFETLRFFGNRFKQQWGARRVATITKGEIEAWLKSLRVSVTENTYRPASSVYEQHHLSHLSQFFIWSKGKHGIPRDNPCEGIGSKAVTADPEFFGLGACEEILKLSLSPEFIDLLPFHAIGLFAGVRTMECERLTWDSVDFDDRSIVLKKDQAKGNAGRRPEILPTLNAWLVWFRKKHPHKPLIPRDLKRKIGRFRLTLGYWIHNGMRHSFASYYLSGIKKDFGALEEIMGNSRTILRRHYVQFPSKRDARDFWNLTPDRFLTEERKAASKKKKPRTKPISLLDEFLASVKAQPDVAKSKSQASPHPTAVLTKTTPLPPDQPPSSSSSLA